MGSEEGTGGKIMALSTGVTVQTKSLFCESASTSPAVSTNSGLFGLPAEIRIKIYKLVLPVWQTLYLFRNGGSRVRTLANSRRNKLELLYTNKQLYNEASSVWYGSNYFNFVDTLDSQFVLLKSFLSIIGSANAGVLSRICINFPAVEEVDSQYGRVQIRQDDLYSLKILQERCPNLTRLETMVHSDNYGALNSKDPEFGRQALEQIHARIKLISSLNRVIVRVFDETVAPSARELMTEFGWVVSRCAVSITCVFH